MGDRIYLDHAATTPLRPEAAEAMREWLGPRFGNPSSLAEEGRRAKMAIDEARETVSAALGCLFAEVIFTSGGTEAANLALLGTALAHREGPRRRVLLGAAEHHCVLHAGEWLRRLGFRVEILPVDRFARVDLDALEDRLADDVLLVAVMHANNELGTIQPVAEVIELARRRGALVFVDAVQSFLQLPSPVALGADLVSVSAHKVNGPPGTGALFVRAGTPLRPVLVGGGQERELRAGTENVAGIVGFAAAVRAHGPDGRARARDEFVRHLEAVAPVPFVLSVDRDVPCLPGHAHLRFPGFGAESILIRLDRAGVSASSGAACSSGSLEPSHVLLAAGYSPAEASEGLRFTFGLGNDLEQAREAARRLGEVMASLARAALQVP